ncbi:MAG: DUF3795 domain-containing protein [Chloroflexota bacterium]|nr:DUF3795 domain-containing protein [Chloroflexota bacterium]
MVETDTLIDLLSFCGLYCGNCSGYKRGMPLMGKCAGCMENGGPPNCGIRECCRTKGYRTCAECDILDDCKLLNTFTHKVARIVFGSDKQGNLAKIKVLGVEAFVQEQIQSGKR